MLVEGFLHIKLTGFNEHLQRLDQVRAGVYEHSFQQDAVPLIKYIHLGLLPLLTLPSLADIFSYLSACSL